MKQEYFDIIKDYLEECPNDSYTAIADTILEDGTILRSHRTLRQYVQKVKQLIDKDFFDATTNQDENTEFIEEKEIIKSPETISTITPEVVAHVNGTVIDGIYYHQIVYGKEKLSISDDTVNELFCAYSRKGLNYNKPQILTTLGVERKIFDALVSKQHLSKESEPLGAYYLDNSTKEEQADKLKTIISDLLESFSESDSNIAETVVKEYKKKMADFRSNSHREEDLFHSLIEHLPKVSVEKYEYDIIGYQSSSNRPLYVVIGDMHIGLETDNFNAEAARVALATMSDNINNQMASTAYNRIILIFLGDVMHTVSGVNHANMWKDIEPGLWGASAIIKPFELITEFVHNLKNVTEIYGVGGNHDRLADRKDLEPSDEGGKLVFFMLDNTFPNIKVVWDPDRVQFTKETITFIVLHGDLGQDKKSGQEIAWNLGNSTKYNLILVGHTHSRQINKNDDGIGFRKMVCPAFCPTDGYAERLGYNSLPGYTLVTPDKNGYPIVSDHPLHYPKLK